MVKGEKKVKYMKIGLETRKKLIRLIEVDGNTLTKAAKRIKIKISTARAIYANYRQKGTIFEKKSQKVKRQLFEEFIREEDQKTL